MPNAARTACVRRPLAVCDCLSRRSADGYSCERCPAGQVRHTTDLSVCVTPACNG
jgi:hypothetical protein